MNKKYFKFVAILAVAFLCFGISSSVFAACGDTDEKDYFVVGTLNFNGKVYTDRCYEKDTRYVLEYYCDSIGKGKAEWKLCPNGCLNGSCSGTSGQLHQNGDARCTNPNWKVLSDWSCCVNGQQTRTVSDLNNCGVANDPNKPAETQSCTCVSDWEYGFWSPCVQPSMQTRTARDLNNCAIPTSKPATRQFCRPEGWTYSAWSECYNGEQLIYATKVGNTFPVVVKRSCLSSECYPDWKFSKWSICENGQQTRNVWDLNECGITTDKPVEMQACTLNCSPWWLYSQWTYCIDGRQTRTYKDYNNCGIGSMSTETQLCSSSSCQGVLNCSTNWQAGVWSACTSGTQTRSYVDKNNCGTTTGKPQDETQACVDTTFICIDNSTGISYNMKDVALVLKQTITRMTDSTCQALLNLIKTFN